MIWTYRTPIISMIAAAGLALLPAAAQEERIPLAFVPNRGQWDAAVQFAAHRQELTAWLQRDGFGLSLHRRQEERVQRAAIQLLVEGASPDVTLQGEEPLAGRYNFFVGRDPERWAAGLVGFARVRYCGIHEGVDLLVRNSRDWLEYDLLLQPGVDLKRVVFRCEGIEALHLDPDGVLVMETTSGAIRQQPPVTWQELANGKRRPVACRFRLVDRTHYGFVAEGLEPDRPTVVDPCIEWSTYLGGALRDYIMAIAQDEAGLITVTGQTESPTGFFPTTSGAFQPRYNGGTWDGFVARLDPSQNGSSQLLWCTYLGGSGTERPNAIALDASGDVVVTGFTTSTNFPTTLGALQPALNGPQDAFVVRLSSSGTQLLYGTYLGGSASDSSGSVDVDARGVITVAGGTGSSTFYQIPNMGGADAYVARLDASRSGAAQLVCATLIGSTGNDHNVWGLEVSNTGDVYIAGQTTSVGFPVTPGAFQTVHGGGIYDAFLSHFNPTLSTLLNSTFLGGPGDEDWSGDLHLDPLGQLTVCGATDSTTNLPFVNSYQGGPHDGFVAQFDLALAQVNYGYYLGGSGDEYAVGLGVASGVATVTGWTNSTNFPITLGTCQAARSGGMDAFVTRLDPHWSGGLQPVYSTYLGGSMSDIAYRSVRLNGTDAATVGGATWSTNFPVTNPYQVANAGQRDGFVTRLSMHPTGVQKYETSAPACLGELAIGVTCMPTSPALNFAFTCTKAPPNALGWLILGFSPLSGVPPFLVAPPWIAVPINGNTADALGYAQCSAPIPPRASGAQLYCQFLFLGTGACGSAQAIYASNALNMRIQ